MREISFPFLLNVIVFILPRNAWRSASPVYTNVLYGFKLMTDVIRLLKGVMLKYTSVFSRQEALRLTVCTVNLNFSGQSSIKVLTP